MLFQKTREELVKYGNLLIENNLTKGTGGNLSQFDPETELVAITPTGIPFDQIRPRDIVIVDLNGTVVEGDKKPTSEIAMHLVFYRKRQDIRAIIHAHTTYATVLACLREPLPATHYMIAVAGPDIRCADYATFGTEELAANAFQAMEERQAVILANHGILAGSHSLANAFNIIEEAEYCSKIYCLARAIGKPVILDEAEMKVMAEKFRSYGQV